MIRLTAELKRTTAAQARALTLLRKRTQRAAVHLQDLLQGEALEIENRTYKVLDVTWMVEKGDQTRVHPQGREVLAWGGERPVSGLWVACYDPREPLRELEGTGVWEIDYRAPGLQVRDQPESQVLLPTAEDLIRFAADYPRLVQLRTQQAQLRLKAINKALAGLVIQEQLHEPQK